MCTGLLKTIDLKIIWAEYPLAKPEGNDECWGKTPKETVSALTVRNVNQANAHLCIDY